MRKHRTAWAEPAQKTVVEKEGALIDATWVGGLSDTAGLLYDRVEGSSEESRTLWISHRAGDDLQRGTLRASEEGTLVRITTVHPRSERGEMGANRLQDSRGTVLNALGMSTERERARRGRDQSGGGDNHWRVTWIVVSHPFGVLTPGCKGPKMERA